MLKKEVMSKEEWSKFVHSNPKIRKYLLASGETDGKCRTYFNKKAQGKSGLVFGYNKTDIKVISGFLSFSGIALLGGGVFGLIQGDLSLVFVGGLCGLMMLGSASATLSIAEPKIKTPVSNAKKALLKQAEHFDKTGIYKPY